MQVLGGAALALPDRRGNKRADTLRNLMTCPDVSLAALVPGSGEVLQLSGTARVGTESGRGARLLGRGLAAAPGALTRRAMDASYRSALRDEGY